MYTQLCRELEAWVKEHDILQNTTVENGQGDAATKKEKGKEVSFRKILLTECQNCFFGFLKPPANSEELESDEQAEAEVKRKHLRKGNILFVGALLKGEMLASKVILQITSSLLQEPVSSEGLETLTHFLTTIGPMFDSSKWTYHADLKKVFATCRQLSTEDRIPPRVRCLLSDVIDLRQAEWEDQKVVTKKDEGPMTLDQVHQKAKEVDNFQTVRGTPKGDRAGNHGSLSRQDSGQSRVSRGNSSGGSAWGQKDSGRSYGGYGKSRQHDGDRDRDRDSRSTDRESPRPTSTKQVSSPPSPSRPSPRNDTAHMRRSLVAAVKELLVSHDIAEALERTKELSIPVEHQANELSHILAQIAEEAKSEARGVCFQFAVKLFSEQVFDSSELMKGLTKLFDKLEDLSLDMPAIPQIMRDEFLPALRELVQADLLTADEMQELSNRVE
jgi:hypothetical protein